MRPLLMVLALQQGDVVRVLLACHVDAKVARHRRRVPAHVAAPRRPAGRPARHRRPREQSRLRRRSDVSVT